MTGGLHRSAASTDRAAGVACAVLSVLLFSSFTLVSRLGLSSSLAPPDLAALRFGIGGILLLPVLLRHGFRGVRARDAVALAALGGLGFALLAYAGFSLAPAAHGAVLLHGTLPLFSHVLARESRRRRAGIVLIAAGIALMAYDSVARASPRQLLGDGLLLGASLAWSGYGVLAQRIGLRPAHGASIVVVLSMIAFLPLYALLPGKRLPLLGARELVLQVTVQGVLIGALSIFVYTRAVAALGAAETALFTAAVPCITLLATIPLLSEVPSAVATAGAVVVTLGMVWARRSRFQAAR
jgi:drug/metabolite transporter (DMT)-like permease